MLSDKHTLIKPLVDHLMESGDISSWRTALSDSGVFTLEETIALDESACRAAFKAMTAMKWMSASVDQLMQELEVHNISWNIEFSEDFRQGAICY